MNNIISEIKVSNNIVLLCHNNPDGDAVGSTIAMYILLKRLGKEVDIVLDTLPKKIWLSKRAFRYQEREY